MEELLKEIKAGIFDRLGNPLVFAFLISWATINHDVLLVLFSDESFLVKKQFLDQHYSVFRSSECLILNAALLNFLFPILLAGGYLLLFTALSRPLVTCNARQKVKLANSVLSEQEKLLVPKAALDEANQINEDMSRKISELEAKNQLLGVEQNSMSEQMEVLKQDRDRIQELVITHTAVRKYVNPEEIRKVLENAPEGVIEIRDLLLMQTDLGKSKQFITFLEEYTAQLCRLNIFKGVGVDLSESNGRWVVFIYGKTFIKLELALLWVVNNAAGLSRDRLAKYNSYLRSVDSNLVSREIALLLDSRQLIEKYSLREDGQTETADIVISDSGKEYLLSKIGDYRFPV